MKKNLTLVLFASLAVGLQAAVVSAPIAHPTSAQGRTIDVNVIDSGVARTERDVFTYDFESDEQGWTSHGTGLTNDTWHVEATGHGTPPTTDVWWSADAATGGYLSSSFVYLDTPSFSLVGATAPTLDFDLFYSVEAPGGEPAPYDGWDTANVWASTDGGGSWTPISGSPAYDIANSFAFGAEFGMGAGIPGWGGSADWQAASFDLSAFIGQSDVRIRFAMCADPAQDYTDDPALTGMEVDNIVIADGATIWSDDGVNNVGGAPTTGYYIYGDEWTYTGHEWNCTNGVNLGCYIESDWIPVTPPALVELVQDIICDLPDATSDSSTSLEDYFLIDYTTNGTDWIQICYDYLGEGRPDWGTNYYTYTNDDVFGDNTLNITLPTATQFKVRYAIRTDGDDSGGNGSGLWVDNVNVLVSEVPEHDLSVTKAWIDYPRTVGEFQLPKVEIANLGANDESNIRAYWKVYADSIGGTVVHPPTPVNTTAAGIAALDSVRVEMLSGAPTPWKWAPAAEGFYVIQFFPYFADTEYDLNHANDTLSIGFTAFEDNFGLLKYDFDLDVYRTLLSPGIGMLVRFDPIDEPWTAQFFAATIYNMFAGDEVSIAIHDEGVDENTAGPLLAMYTATVAGPEDVYPNNFFRYIGQASELRCIDHPIWIGIRGNATNSTGIIALSDAGGGPYWEGHTFDYDYTTQTTTPYEGDAHIWMQVDWGVESELPLELNVTGTLASNQYTLEWNSPGPVDGYLVYRSADGYDFSGAPVADLDNTTLSYVDTVVGGQRWFYRVVGYNSLCPVPAE